MAVDFCDYFWGEKNEGFHALYQNMKGGILAIKELADFLKERAKLEEENSKAYLKLSKQLNAGSACGTFSPMLLALKVSTEKLSNIHNQWTHKLLELVKDVLKYSDELHKTHKQVKDDESVTSDSVKSLQDTTTLLQKAKEVYKQRCLELEKLKRDNSSVKELEKSEAKFRKSQEDYKTLVDKYCIVRDDFERKMTLAAKHFQDVEGGHLKQMREFVETYCQIVDNNNNQVGRVYQEFQIQLTDLTVDNMLEQFTLAKHTGLEKPGPIEFDEEKISIASATGPPSDISDRSGGSEKLGTAATTTSGAAVTTSATAVDLLNVDLLVSTEIMADPGTPTQSGEDSNSLHQEQQNSASPTRSPHASKAGWTVSGFLKRNRKKEKKKKTSVTKDGSNGGNAATLSGSTGEETQVKDIGSDGEDVRKSETPTPEVDDEGFSKQPAPSGPNDPWSDFNQPKKNFYSSSDDSDDESKRKIKVEIKPVRANGAATPSFDELSSAIGKLELAPPPLVTRELRTQNEMDGIRRSQSQTQINLPGQGLLGLSLHPMDPIDNQTDDSKPETESPAKKFAESAFSQAPFVADFSKAPPPPLPSQLDTSTTSKEVQDIFGDFSTDQQPALPPKQNTSQIQRERITNSLIALPRPPSRMGIGTRARGSPSPAPAEIRRLSRNESTISTESAGSGNDLPVSAPPTATSPNPISNSSSGSDFDAFRTPYGLSRGPSPLTLGMADVVPLAVAFQEVCHVCFRGIDESNCQVRLIGDMMISFPAGIVQVVATNPNPSPLLFRIKNSESIEAMVPNKHLISMSETLSTPESGVFEFDMKSLKELLRKQHEQNPNASYFNLDLLKYQVKAKPGAGSCPLQMVAYWKCTDSHTDLRLDYKYNGHAMASPCPLLNLSVAVPVGGGVTNMQSQPNGIWIAESGRALWKFTELSQHNNAGVGSLRGRFQLKSGPGSQGTIAAQFNCEGTTLSGIDFELVGSGYRLSLVKRRFVSGKYICDGDASSDNRYRYAAPQSINHSDDPSEC